MRQVNVAVVSYQNTIPFLYGLRHSDINSSVNLILTPPYQCAQNLKDGVADVALIPAVKLLEIENIEIISDYCISATREVYSVALFSDSPLDSIKTIYLDTDSRTSVELVKILAREYWQISPQWRDLSDVDNVDSDEGCLLIGDKVFEHESKFKYKYDLATHWNIYTGKPFVFAVWVAKKGVDKNIISQTNTALKFGVGSIDQAIEKYGAYIPKDKLYTYLTKNLEFDLTQDKRDGLKLFLSKVKEPSSHK